MQMRPTYTNGTPPPPPNFDDDFGGEVVPRVKEETAVYNSAPPAEGSGKKTAVYTPPPEPTRHLVVEIKPVGNWRDACRRSLEKVSEYTGRDTITLHFVDTHLYIDFPQRRTRTSSDLLQNLRLIPGVARVYEKENSN